MHPLAEATAVFGTISTALGLANITLGRLTELCMLVRSYKKLHKDTSKAVQNTRKVVELLTNLQNDERVGTIGCQAIERASCSLMEINTNLNKRVVFSVNAALFFVKRTKSW